MMAVQPQSLSHGVNLQKGGHQLAWIAPPDQNEIFIQFNKRLHRMGQEEPVFVHVFIAKGTVDEMRWQRLQDKGENQKSLLDSLREYRKQK